MIRDRLASFTQFPFTLYLYSKRPTGNYNFTVYILPEAVIVVPFFHSFHDPINSTN